MLVNYLKVALRNILKHKSFSAINIFGLAAAMSVCMLIMLIIADQSNYDSFHTNRHRIYRVQTRSRNGNGKGTATSALPLAAVLKKDYTGIEAAAVLTRNIGGELVYKDKIASGGGYFTDGNLFKIMDFKLDQGDPATALEKPFSLVISAELAAQLFPHDNPIGKTITFNQTGINPAGMESGNMETKYGQFNITGVLQPNPGKTTLPFKLLASLNTLKPLAKDSILNTRENNWGDVWNNYTFVLLEKGRSRTDLQAILDKISDKQYPKGHGDQFAFQAVALKDLMPSDVISNPTNIAIPKMVLLVLSVLCLVVMLSACLNYTNLSVARLLTRAKEVGIRKVSGATRRQIFTQFISEAILTSLVSLILATLLLLFFQYVFTNLWLNQFLNISFHYTPGLILLFVGFSIAVGLIAGLLPSIYISLFNPVNILKGLSNMKLFKRLTMRKVLLVIQFSVSLIFIISTSLIYLQGKHILNFNYGFDKDNVVNIKMLNIANYDRLAQAVSTNRNIVAVSACGFSPATGTNNGSVVHKAADKRDSLWSNYIDIDAGCINVWGLQLTAGRNLPAIPAEKEDHYVLVNEKFVSDAKYVSANQAIGQHLILDNHDAEIVGVVRNFQFLDVSRQMEPLILRNRRSEFGSIAIRIQGKDVAGTMAFLQNSWKKVNPTSKFEYSFLDQDLLMTHSMMSNVAGIIGALASLAVIISCLGLLGMATYTAETRRKEVSVRKVLGSSTLQVIVLLSKGFMSLLVVAVAISIPIAWFINNMWLQSFASRISITPAILLVNILILGALNLLIVFSQAWKVSTANPATSLRSE